MFVSTISRSTVHISVTYNNFQVCSAFSIHSFERNSKDWKLPVVDKTTSVSSHFIH